MVFHHVHFYDNELDFRAKVVAFLQQGFHSGESCLVIARPGLNQHVRHWLNADHPAINGDSCLTLDAETTLSSILVNGQPDAQRFESVVGEALNRLRTSDNRPVRAVGEMVALLCAQGRYSAAIQLEHLWREFVERDPITLLCAYPLELLEPRATGTPSAVARDAQSIVASVDDLASAEEKEGNLQQQLASLQRKAEALENELAIRELLQRASDQKTAELGDFVENAAEGLHRVGADGTILWANRAELELLGYSAEEYIGRNIRDFHADPPTINKILTTLLGGDVLRAYPARLRSKDAGIKHVEISSSGAFFDGRLQYTRCFTRDVTDRVRLEEALQQKMQQLADTDRRKDEFLAVLGHELRNPLAPLASSLELLSLKGEDPATRDRACAIMRRQLGMAKRLVDDLLDVSRITTQKLAVRRSPVSIQHILKQSIETTGPAAAVKSIVVRSDLTQQPIVVDGDESRLIQAISNLLNNAIKFSERGGTIDVEMATTETTITVSIRDYGIGMSSELQSKAFELFTQGPGPTQGIREGLGVGLGIVRHIIDLHAGKVTVKSAGPNTGCEFAVTLPRLQDATIPPRETHEPPDAARTFSLIIADDNVDAANALGEIFRALNHDVRLFHDSSEALADALRQPPEVLILDVGMPGMDGYELARRIRTELGDAPLLIAATGYGQVGDIQTALEAGFNFHLTKPVDLRELIQLLQDRGVR